MPYETVKQIVGNYTEGIRLVAEAYDLLMRGQVLLESITSHPSVLPDNHKLYDDRQCNTILKKLKAEAWRGILAKTDARKFMTDKRYAQFGKSLEDPESIPEITIEAVNNFVLNLIESAPDMILEFVRETFNWLQPGFNSYTYKTNEKSKYELHDKIIKEYMFENIYRNRISLQYRTEQPLRAMDAAFHLLDGKGMPKNGNSAACSAIRAAEQAGKQRAETNYFSFKWYKKGTCHITFKRMDLVNRMNQIAGEGLLRGE